MTMKNYMKLSLVTVVLVVLAFTSSNAQDRNRANRGMQNLSNEEIASNRTTNLDKVLNLSEEQKGKIEEAYLEFLMNQKKVREKYKDNPEKLESKMDKTRKGLDKKMTKILSSEQYTLFQEQSKNRRQRASMRGKQQE